MPLTCCCLRCASETPALSSGRYDLVHKHFRKLCNTLIEIDEWGQVIVIGMLTSYSRANFRDPNKSFDALGGTGGVTAEENFYGKEDDDESEEEEVDDNGEKVTGYMMDPDHRLLLRSAVPLLQSRNNAVRTAFWFRGRHFVFLFC